MGKKINRELVKQKFNGLCAYTGKPLGDDWQVDHVLSKYSFGCSLWGQCKDIDEYNERKKDVDLIDNLFPAIKIINHYKRSLDLEGFRDYIKTLHFRIARLPKKTSVERTANRIKYLNTVAELFEITPDKPFSGIFYFETLNK